MTPRTRRQLLDTALATAMVVALWLRVSAPFESEAVAPDWGAYLLTGLLGAILLVRRRRPVAVLTMSIVLLLAYYASGYGAVGAIWPLSVALYTVAEQGHWRAGAVLGGFVLGGSAVFRVLVEVEPVTAATLADVFNELVLGTALLLAGAMVRSRRQLADQAHAREVAVRAEASARRERELTQQRLDIARDVHDLVAHSLAGIGVQARLAAEQVDDGEPDAAQTTIATIDDATRDALAGLRQTVGGLRGAPVPDDLAAMVGRVSGVAVTLVRPSPPATPDPDRERLVTAIVREALTNVVRHAGADRAHVRVDDGRDRTTVVVRDDGRGGPVVAGHGLVGMRERLTAIGGTLALGDAPEGGLAVTAVMPNTAPPVAAARGGVGS